MGTFPMYILLLASIRGGDSRAIEQIYVCIIHDASAKIHRNLYLSKILVKRFRNFKNSSYLCTLKKTIYEETVY